MVVLGSNLGWQCLFAALSFGISVDGFELVEYRWKAATEFAVSNEVINVLNAAFYLVCFRLRL